MNSISDLLLWKVLQLSSVNGSAGTLRLTLSKPQHPGGSHQSLFLTFIINNKIVNFPYAFPHHNKIDFKIIPEWGTERRACYLSKWEDLLPLKWSFYLKIKYKFKEIPIGIPMGFYMELIKITICFMWLKCV